jgi:hypothetical protein
VIGILPSPSGFCNLISKGQAFQRRLGVRFGKSISIFAAFPLALAVMWGCAVNPVTGKREIMEFKGMADDSSLSPGKKLKIKPLLKER